MIAGFQRIIDRILSTILTDSVLGGHKLFIRRFVVTPLSVSKKAETALANNNIEIIGR